MIVLPPPQEPLGRMVPLARGTNSSGPSSPTTCASPADTAPPPGRAPGRRDAGGRSDWRRRAPPAHLPVGLGDGHEVAGGVDARMRADGRGQPPKRAAEAGRRLVLLHRRPHLALRLRGGLRLRREARPSRGPLQLWMADGRIATLRVGCPA